MRWRAWMMVAVPLLGAAASGDAQRAPDPRRAALDRTVPALLARHKVPSVSIAHVERGRIVLAAAYGEQSPGVPATTRTLYNVASLTKPVSAELVLRLAARGELSLDEPMAAHWVDPDVAADPRHRLLTPRLALSHRTGFKNWRWLEDDKRLRFGFAPGTGVGYSGEGYEYTKRFVEEKTGERFDALAERLVLRPAGARETAYTVRPWFAGRVAVPVSSEGRAIPPVARRDALASDDIHTTASDYARFLVAAMNARGLTPTLAADRQRVHASTRHLHCTGAKAASCPAELGFGLGWEVHRYAGLTILMHTGADSGEFTAAYFDPATRTGSVILTNSQHGYKVVVDIMDRLGTAPPFLRFLRAQAGE